MTDSTYSWSNGMRSDSIQLSNRLQTIIRFQIANDLQVFLNQILTPSMQLLGIFLLIVCTEVGVRRLNMYSFTLIRAVVVIQSGQCLLQYIDSIDGEKSLAAGAQVQHWAAVRIARYRKTGPSRAMKTTAMDRKGLNVM